MENVFHWVEVSWLGFPLNMEQCKIHMSKGIKTGKLKSIFPLHSIQKGLELLFANNRQAPCNFCTLCIALRTNERELLQQDSGHDGRVWNAVVYSCFREAGVKRLTKQDIFLNLSSSRRLRQTSCKLKVHVHTVIDYLESDVSTFAFAYAVTSKCDPRVVFRMSRYTAMRG